MANYVYGMATGYNNLRKHLASKHSTAYDEAIVQNNWGYRLSHDVKSGKSNAVEARKRPLPPFTSESFLEYIVRFVVADDQVSNACSAMVPPTYDMSSPLSQFVLSSVLNFVSYACSSAQAFLRKRSPVDTESARESYRDGTNGSRA